MFNSNNNRVRLNMSSGNGAATSKLSPTTSNNFGLSLLGTSGGNEIENNKLSGNVNGILIASPRRNVIRRNIVVGNPAVQVSKDYGTAIGADIQDLSPAGTNSFEGNYCLTYVGRGATPCPKDLRDEGEEQRAAFPTAVDSNFKGELSCPP